MPIRWCGSPHARNVRCSSLWQLEIAAGEHSSLLQGSERERGEKRVCDPWAGMCSPLEAVQRLAGAVTRCSSVLDSPGQDTKKGEASWIQRGHVSLSSYTFGPGDVISPAFLSARIISSAVKSLVILFTLR